MVLSFKCITWNMGASVKKTLNYDFITHNDEDIILISLQEVKDDKNFISNIYNKINEILEGYDVHIYRSPKNNKIINGAVNINTFVVVSLICIKNGLGHNQLISESICFKGFINLACTKYANITKFVVIKESISYNIIFIGCHLQIDTKDKDLGLKLRIDDMEKIIEKINNTTFDLVLWTGDLNFRMLPTDQLETFLKNKQNKDKKIIEPNKTFKETCRFTECGEPNCNRPYDIKRVPSFCDRVLYVTDNNKCGVKNIQYDSINTGEITYSDHNLVFFIGELTKNTNKSGGYYNKYTEIKNNYLQLKNKNLKI